jgi:hypothetical protein
MVRTDTGRFSITRLLTIAVLLLLVPFSALAAGTGSPDHAASSNGVLGDHHASILPDSIERQDVPSEEPLHCHLRTQHPQEVGLSQAAVDGDLPLLAPHCISASLQATKMPMPINWARIPIPALSRFILFGNFRS